MKKKLVQHKIRLIINTSRSRLILLFLCVLCSCFLFSLVIPKQDKAIAYNSLHRPITDSKQVTSTDNTIAIEGNLNNSKESINPHFVANQTPLTMSSKMAFNQFEEFPLGIYDRIDKPEHLDAMKAIGFNLVMPYTEPYAKKNYQTIKKYLDAADRKGLKVVLEIFRDSIKQQNTAEIANYVRTFKNHPALYGWYSYDEPVYNKISPEVLETTYNAVKSEDKDHPVFLDFSGVRSHNLTRYRNSFDICQINQYPLERKSNALEVLGSFQSDIQRVDNLTDTPFLLVVQSFQDNKWRLPSFKEQKYMMYSGLLNGADGLFFYSYHRAPEEWRKSVLRPLVAGLKMYLPTIEKGALKGKVESDSVQVALFKQKQNNKYALIAINHSKRKLNPSIKLDRDIKLQSATEKRNKLTINEAQNSFNDSFNPFEAKIYDLVAN